jgi:hypothetical protein
MHVTRRTLRLASRSTHRALVLGLLVSLAAAPARAVFPLTVDDADTVPPDQLQLNAGWFYSRFERFQLQTAPVNPVFGLGPDVELGAAFGYQHRHGGPFGSFGDVTDLVLGTKWRAWRSPGGGLMLGGRLDVKLPSASRPRGFGTGNPDALATVIATGCFGPTCLDFNGAYGALNLADGDSDNDVWFLGQAVRQALDERWTLVAEAWGQVPAGAAALPAQFEIRGGAQWSPRTELVVSALVGGGAGRGSANLVAIAGLTWTF